jgi:hypothetical protein
MSTKNKKNIVSQALLEMDAITSAIKEESKNTLNTFLAEAVRNALREGCEEEEEKDYDVIDEKDTDDDEKETKGGAKSDVDEDDNTEMEPQAMQGQQQQAPAQAQQMPAANDGAEPQQAPMDGEGEEGWDEFSQYQSDENTYDLTGENDYEKVVKVFKLLKDDDQVVVKKDSGTIFLQDNEAGTEYVIDLGGEDMDDESMEGEEMENPEMNINESEIAGFGDDFEDDDFEDSDYEEDEEDIEFHDDDEIEDEQESDWDWHGNLNRFDSDGALSMAAQGDDDDLSTKYARAYRPTHADFDHESFDDSLEDDENKLDENKKSRKPMKESKEVLFEVDLGYTDNYQDKDPIAGLSNNEPSKKGKSWDNGAPKGTKKPWAGKSKKKGLPFSKEVNEMIDNTINEYLAENPTNLNEENMQEVAPLIGAILPILMKSIVPMLMKTLMPMIMGQLTGGMGGGAQAGGDMGGAAAAAPVQEGALGVVGDIAGNVLKTAGDAVSGDNGSSEVNEDEMPQPEAPIEETIGGAVKTRTSSKNNMPKGRKEYAPKVGRHNSFAGEYSESVNENLKKENRELKEAIVAIRKNLSEAYVTNANLGKITKLFLENTTSQSEKVDIVNRFSNEAKTIEQSNTLYESIKRELSSSKPSLNINESKTAKGTQVINENKVYKSDDLIKTIDLMNRITNI